MDNSDSVTSTSSQLFNVVSEPTKWFLGLRWYVILFIVVFGSFIFMQLESAFELRRNASKAKKEGLETANVEKIKGIIQQTEKEYIQNKVKKHVTFGEPTTHSFFESVPSLSLDGVWSGIGGVFYKIYNWWIVPGIYILFRSIVR